MSGEEDYVEINLLYNYNPSMAQFAIGIADSLSELRVGEPGVQKIGITTLEAGSLSELEGVKHFLAEDPEAKDVNALVVRLVKVQ